MSQAALTTPAESALPAAAVDAPNTFLRVFSKLLAVATLALIFFGGQVKSHEAGLSVPDWPLTYGQNPITYPLDQWVGGIFYEHSHRLFAGGVALGSCLLAALAWFLDKRAWVKKLAIAGVVAVLIQAVLGGMTVWYQLPVLVSSSHGLLAQTYLLINIILAYAFSTERAERDTAVASGKPEVKTPILYGALALIALLYVQLILGALTRHTESGLAIPDFPTTAGQWIPSFNQDTVDKINALRDGKTDAVGTPLDDVQLYQIVIHFLHRVGAVVIVAFIALLTWLAVRYEKTHPHLLTLAYLLSGTVIAQFVLGMTIIMTQRSPAVASIHVTVGAATLAFAGLLALRAWPIKAGAAR